MFLKKRPLTRLWLYATCKHKASSKLCNSITVMFCYTYCRSASWGNLHQTSAANIGRVWELSTRVSSLESEVRKTERGGGEKKSKKKMIVKYHHCSCCSLLQLSSARAEVVRLEGVRIGLETQCSRYESQLHRVQAQMVEEMDEKERSIDKLRAEMEKHKVQPSELLISDND